MRACRSAVGFALDRDLVVLPATDNLLPLVCETVAFKLTSCLSRIV